MTYDEHVDCDRQLCEADDKIIQLRKEIERLREENRWIPVSERLPEVPLGPPNASSESVWLIYKNKPHIGYYTNFDGWRVHVFRFQTRLMQKDITHWKPIVLPKQALSTGGGQTNEGTSLDKSAHGGVPPSSKEGNQNG